MINPNEMIRILIVDDEESIVEFLRMGLNAAGYFVFAAYDGVQAIALAKDVVVCAAPCSLFLLLIK